MKEDTGKFIVSLDFELLWGMRDIETAESYGSNILGVWETLPTTLELFKKYSVKATFATVGFLFASTKEELLSYFPEEKPSYLDKNLSPYNGHLDLVKANETEDKFHFATELIELIKKYPGQEIATHTFSHYYCLEKGQTKEDFRKDILAAIEIAKKWNIELKSLVFPRNQFNDEYLKIIQELGISSYRGNGKEWFNTATSANEEKLIKRAFRLLDTYINLSRHDGYTLEEIAAKKPFDIPSSRFLRPYTPKLKRLEGLRLNRILNNMTRAAKKGRIFHLWWHPHNFGSDQKENFEFLTRILIHYKELNKKYGFESQTMLELSNKLEDLSTANI